MTPALDRMFFENTQPLHFSFELLKILVLILTVIVEYKHICKFYRHTRGIIEIICPLLETHSHLSRKGIQQERRTLKRTREVIGGYVRGGFEPEQDFSLVHIQKKALRNG